MCKGLLKEQRSRFLQPKRLAFSRSQNSFLMVFMLNRTSVLHVQADIRAFLNNSRQVQKHKHVSFKREEHIAILAVP